MTSATNEAMNVTMLTAPMKTGRRSAFRARAAIQVARVGAGGVTRCRVGRRGLMRG
jgi:hypothetical protein